MTTLDINDCSKSATFWEIPHFGYRLDYIKFTSFSGRWKCCELLFKKLWKLPFAFLFKTTKTVFRSIGLFLSLFILIFSFGCIDRFRQYFIDQILTLAKDLADWILWPLAIIGYFIRTLLGILIHPGFYFGF